MEWNGGGSGLSFGLGLLPRFDVDEFVSLVRRLDSDEIFDNLWIPDERFLRDMAVTLTLAALNSERLLLGSAVTDAFVRHPALTATIFASLDEVSGGRALVGIGAGAAGLPAMGIERNRPYAAIRDAVEIMRRMWSGESVDYQGTVSSFHGHLDFSPPRPRIPIWIAGRGPKILELAGEVGDGVLIGGLVSRAGLDFAADRLRAGQLRSGRSGSSVSRGIWLHLAIHRDGELARDAVRQIVATVVHLSPDIVQTVGLSMDPVLYERIKNADYSWDSRELLEAGQELSSDVLDAFSVSGTPDEVLAGLDRLASAGITHVAVLPWLSAGQSMAQYVELLSDTLRTRR